MNLKILRKDLKRKKSMNLILLLFVMLATTFIAASLNNLKVVTNGLDYYFEKAGLCDFVIDTISVVNGEETGNDVAIEDFLKEQENVTKYEADTFLMITQDQIEEIGDAQMDTSNTVIVSSIECKGQKFFDENNQEIDEVGKGEVYFPRKLLNEKIKVGDSFYVVAGDYKKKFTIKGVMKDALLGSDMMGMSRMVIGQQDYDELTSNGEFASGHMYSVFCDDLQTFEKDYNNCEFNVLVGFDMDTMRMTYVMDMITAAILLAVSICLILIAAVMLRFTILFTVNEDYKEIGIMKAIGIPDMTIRRLYISKYLAISIVGAVIGFFLSIPFSQMLVAGVTKNIVVEDSASNILLTVITSILVVLVVIFFAFTSTGRIKKVTPMDAIRSGNNGERFGKKAILSMGKSRLRTTTFMAVNDVLCELKKYMVLLVTCVIGIWLVVMPVNTINTLQSDRVADWFGMVPCDFYIREQGRIEEIVLEAKASGYKEYLTEIKERLEDEGIAVERVVIENQFRIKIEKGEESFKTTASQGVGTKADQYMYEEGTPPAQENEIAITHVVAEKIHAKIGDMVYVTMFDKKIPFVVTAIYQSMDNMGEGIRFHEDVQMEYSATIGAWGAQVVLKGSPDKEEVQHIIKKVEKLMPDAKVQTPKEFINSMIGGISDQLKPVKSLLLTIVIIINILVVVLMQKMFLIREQGEMGMLKSIGFSNSSIISWQTKRIALVLLIGVVLGTATGTAFSQLTSGQVFKMMGCSRIEFQIRPWEVYVLYPAAIYVATVIACMITMLKVRRISVESMNEEE